MWQDRPHSPCILQCVFATFSTHLLMRELALFGRTLPLMITMFIFFLCYTLYSISVTYITIQSKASMEDSPATSVASAAPPTYWYQMDCFSSSASSQSARGVIVRSSEPSPISTPAPSHSASRACNSTPSSREVDHHYELTRKGRDLLPILRDMADWSAHYPITPSITPPTTSP